MFFPQQYWFSVWSWASHLFSERSVLTYCRKQKYFFMSGLKKCFQLQKMEKLCPFSEVHKRISSLCLTDTEREPDPLIWSSPMRSYQHFRLKSTKVVLCWRLAQVAQRINVLIVLFISFNVIFLQNLGRAQRFRNSGATGCFFSCPMSSSWCFACRLVLMMIITSFSHFTSAEHFGLVTPSTGQKLPWEHQETTQR